jgi:pimeloyl-ACP methyl ester carboxylesterase
MEIDWSGQRVDTNELTINYARAGKGAPLVLLHGWPEFNRTWLHNMPVLADHFDVIAPDLRGFGRTISKTPRSPSGTPPQLLARDLKDFADALGLGRFAIVSHDIGSFVAQSFTQAYPERVSALFFFNCAYPGIGRRWGESENFPELWYQQFHQKDFAAALVGSSREAATIYFRHFLTHWAHQKDSFTPYLEEWVDTFLRPGNLQGGFDWYIGVSRFRSRMMREGAITVPRIDCPTYVLWGRHDPVLQFAWSDRLGEYFSDLTLECAEEAGHFVHFECPHLANRRVVEFLGARLGRASA